MKRRRKRELKWRNWGQLHRERDRDRDRDRDRHRLEQRVNTDVPFAIEFYNFPFYSLSFVSIAIRLGSVTFHYWPEPIEMSGIRESQPNIRLDLIVASFILIDALLIRWWLLIGLSGRSAFQIDLFVIKLLVEMIDSIYYVSNVQSIQVMLM